jgi:hypothetical protein
MSRNLLRTVSEDFFRLVLQNHCIVSTKQRHRKPVPTAQLGVGEELVDVDMHDRTSTSTTCQHPSGPPPGRLSLPTLA